MKITLASYFEPQNHGKGRKIGVTPSKPKNIKEDHGYTCDLKYDSFSPEDIYWDYFSAKKVANGDEEQVKAAGETFDARYRARLEILRDSILEQVGKDKSNKKAQELLGLQDGDSLLSWELKGHLTFRSTLAEFLRGFGYDVIEN